MTNLYTLHYYRMLIYLLYFYTFEIELRCFTLAVDIIKY